MSGVSVVITALNEDENLDGLLSSLIEQEFRPFEIVFVDGGSRDETVDVARRFVAPAAESGITLVIHVVPGANIARGRNIGVRAASGVVVAVTDAGCRPVKTWLRDIVAPIRAGDADLVGGFFRAVGSSRLQQVLARLTVASRPGRGFLPSSRSIAFRRDLWARVGGYPEWLLWGEDTRFDLDCIATGARMVVVPEAWVAWEVRSTVHAIWKQFYRYAWGDALAARVTSSLLVGPIAIHACLVAAFAWSPLAAGAIFALPLTWILRRKGWGLHDLPMAYLVAGTIQLARTLGYLRGWIDRVISARRLRRSQERPRSAD